MKNIKIDLKLRFGVFKINNPPILIDINTNEEVNNTSSNTKNI